MPGGSFIGALFSGYLTDKLGRRRAIQIGCAIWIIGSIISCAAQSIGMLIAGRFINGLSVGICSAQVPVYVTELAPPSKRGVRQVHTYYFPMLIPLSELWGLSSGQLRGAS